MLKIIAAFLVGAAMVLMPSVSLLAQNTNSTVFEIGPTLSYFLMALLTSIPGWLTYLQARHNKATVERIEKDVNSTATALAKVAEEDKAKSEAKDRRILELAERLAKAESMVTQEKAVTEAVAELDPVALPKIDALEEKVDEIVEGPPPSRKRGP